MPALVNYRGEEDFRSIGTKCASSLILSLAPLEVYCPPRKRSRITAPFVLRTEPVQKKQVSIEVLPDECLLEILRRLPGDQERSLCAFVSKRWLSLLSSIRRAEICSDKPAVKKIEAEATLDSAAEEDESMDDGSLTRRLDGKKATDNRLTALAVGAAGHGGLGKLVISDSSSARRVTDVGLSAVGRCCPSLMVLSLRNVLSVGDEGISEIAKGCSLLETLDLCECPLITDKGIGAIAENCPGLTSLSLESCPGIGNESLQAIARHCPNLKSLSIKDCPLVGDQGIASLVSSASMLASIKLQGAVNISDLSLAVIGHYGLEVTDLSLFELNNVSEKGFWVMGNGHGLQKLRSLAIACCRGVTDLGLAAVSNGCPNLKLLNIKKCLTLSDEGLKSFTKYAVSLKKLHLEECHNVTQAGVLAALSNCSLTIKELSLIKCFGIRETLYSLPQLSPCMSLRSLTIRYCPGFGSAGLALVGSLCPKLQKLDLEGICGAIDAGLVSLIKSCDSALFNVNLSGCINISDAAVVALAEEHGGALEVLNLSGCRRISDVSMKAIAENCYLLVDLDVSQSGITDMGVAFLARAEQLCFQVLSFNGCHHVTDSSVPFLRELGGNLVGLNLQSCSSMSGNAVELTEVNISVFLFGDAFTTTRKNILAPYLHYSTLTSEKMPR